MDDDEALARVHRFDIEQRHGLYMIRAYRVDLTEHYGIAKTFEDAYDQVVAFGKGANE